MRFIFYFFVTKSKTMIRFKNDNTTRTKAKQEYAWAYLFHNPNFDSHSEDKQSKSFNDGGVLHYTDDSLRKKNLYWFKP